MKELKSSDFSQEMYIHIQTHEQQQEWTRCALEHFKVPTNVVLSKWAKLKTNHINLKAWGGMLGICSWSLISWHLISSLCMFRKFSTRVSAARQLHTNYTFHFISFLLFWKSTAFYFNKNIHIFFTKLRVSVHCISKQILKVHSHKELSCKMK